MIHRLKTITPMIFVYAVWAWITVEAFIGFLQ